MVRCVIHGSFRKHFDEIRRVHRTFTTAGIEVLAPADAEIVSFENNFAHLARDEGKDPRLVELLYLHNLKRLGPDGFSYFVNPGGYVGASASYELGIAHATNTRCFFLEPLADHPAYAPGHAVWKPERLAEFVRERGRLPKPRHRQNEAAIRRLWEGLMVPGSVISVGGVIEFDDPHAREKDILLVKTHKWGGRYSMVGGTVRRNELLSDALEREIREETGLRGAVGQHVCTFDEIRNSGYYLPGVQHVFVDKIVSVGSRRVELNDEAQSYVWMPASAALRDLDIEPNARHTIELYHALHRP
ncbi:MAG TPA: NUDIX domain-containing protein [Candidatus Paceibacterota bacterium]|nr:NUDIX domain-containing protein [Candidatus Paceibacterota bacterium]